MRLVIARACIEVRDDQHRKGSHMVQYAKRGVVDFISSIILLPL